MPSPPRWVISPISGTPQYARYLDRLLKAAQKRGMDVPHKAALVELALADLGAKLGLVAPPRCAPHGTNRYGEPRKED